MPNEALEDRKKSSSVKPLQALLPFIQPYWRTLLAALGALSVAAAAMLTLPVAVRFVIDRGLAAEDAATIDRYFAYLLLVAGVFGLFAALRFYLITWLGERVVADIRSAVYRHIVRLDPAFFEITRTGEVLSRLTTDTTLIQSIAGVNLSITLRSVLTLIGSLLMLAVTSPELMGLILILVPLVIIPIILIARRVRKLSRETQDRIADTSGLAGETLNAIQTVQAYTLENLQTEQFDHTVELTFVTAVRRIQVRAMLTAVAVVFIFGAITLVLWIGAHNVLAGEMTSGQLGQFLLYAMFVASSSASLSEMWGEMQRAAGAMERLLELMNAEPNISAPPDPVKMPLPGRGEIDMDKVSFSYPSRPGIVAIDQFSLKVKPGETIAFVGPSGAGKSTLFQLLLRFYDPCAGQIKIDGTNLIEADPRDVRAGIGLVPQDTVIFSTSAKENIAFGRPGASSDEVRAAARAAAADQFIEALPEGYDTFLGERGSRLSGGQRQRIAIARAILKDPPILLLDEATSSLDAESERLVQEALEHLMEKRTTIIIAHRLATVRKADRIVVLDHGRMINTGSHRELLQRDPLYTRLAELQFGEAIDNGRSLRQ
ncbi:MAG: ABC transporter transmembrane domain-containing protein [Arenicellales bacterium]